ncbi:PilZ domain-containing protein [Sphingobium chlorophenolicum]|uniref:Type IV pilus assembly PilZ n=1 Tax=Sphingobium chlorophenolicum TaxID=46429 RepID=A0A081R2D6_SPHCR|nr:PilZ domain-containing protein [Sphingobium chlorophenolicum]KEQ49359.1 Type IV pilus assembly PilZ [Sphingobium chlorophenolicum]
MPNLFLANAAAAIRVSNRQKLLRPSTLRLRERPFDVVIDDLSDEGCRISAPVALAAGQAVSLGLPGVGTCTARVIWSDGKTAGCQFDQPLLAGQIEKIRLAHTVVAASFGGALHVDREGETMSLPSKFRRGVLIVGLSLLSWGVFGFLVWAVKTLAASL